MGFVNLSLWVRALALLSLFMVPRLCLIGDARWTSEESWFFSEIFATGQGQRWSALGTPVSGTHGAHPGPYFYWLLAPFSWTASPWLVSLGVALMDSIGHLLALSGLRILWREHKDWSVALIVAGLVLALSPWALLYADRPWNSNLVSLPVGMAIFGLASWWRNASSWRSFGVLTIGLATLPSFHLSAPIIGLPMLAAVLWRWRRLTQKSVLIGALLSVLIWTPYGLHEWRHSGANTAGLLKRSLPSVSSPQNTLLALSWPLRLVSPDIGYHAQRGYWSAYQPGAWIEPTKAAGRAWSQTHGGLALPGVIIGCLLMLSLWITYGFRMRKPEHRTLHEWILVTGTFLGLALLLFAGRRAYPHYLHPMIPFYAGAVGWGFAQLWRNTKLRLILSLGFALSVVTGLSVTHRFQHHHDRLYGLQANLYSIDILRRFGSVNPVFCGALGYRSKGQLERLARVPHPERPLFGSNGSLIHIRSGQAPESLLSSAQWHEAAHGIDHILVLGPLPQAARRLGCR